MRRVERDQVPRRALRNFGIVAKAILLTDGVKSSAEAVNPSSKLQQQRSGLRQVAVSSPFFAVDKRSHKLQE